MISPKISAQTLLSIIPIWDCDKESITVDQYLVHFETRIRFYYKCYVYLKTLSLLSSLFCNSFDNIDNSEINGIQLKIFVLQS